MKLRFLLFSSLLVTLFICLYSIVKSNSAGAPEGVTGNPKDGGTTCNSFGCHSDHALNNSAGTLAIQLLDSPTPVSLYIPGKTYLIKLHLSRSASKVFGFEAAVFANNSGNMAGTLSIDSNDEQVNDGYATHTKPIAPGIWSLKWVAPPKGTGTVQIYATGNAANGDGLNSGDFIYTKRFDVPELTTGINEAEKFIQKINIYPNPIHDQLHISFSLTKAGNTTLSIADLNGKIVQGLYSGMQEAGEHEFTFHPGQLPAGIYMLRIGNNGVSDYEKVIVR